MNIVYELFAEHGASVLAWVLSILGALLARFVWTRISRESIRQTAARAYQEVAGAVLEVAQTYASELKAARADGKLTPGEKAEAKRRAVAAARSNIGPKGLKRLGRILGMASVDSWLESKTEAAVATLKRSGISTSPVVPNPS